MSDAPDGSDPAEAAGLLRLLRRSGADIECQVQGRSMAPAIPDGARVRIRLDGATAAGPDAAVALLIGGDTFSVHRLVHRGKSPRARGYVLTHGDGNIFCDAPHPESLLLGSVLAVQAEGMDDWQPVPVPVRQRLPRRALTAIVAWAVRGGLELHPVLGTAAKGLVVALMTPVVWLRPYPADRLRSGSRLLGSKPVAPA